ncbi:hypothetical protein HK102_005445, partial [Quaeritorhiza haematococci]
ECPVCRTSSNLVVPSNVFPTNAPQKQLIITSYKNVLAKIPCRYFENSPSADRTCPFGDECLYAHNDASGNRVPCRRPERRRRPPQRRELRHRPPGMSVAEFNLHMLHSIREYIETFRGIMADEMIDNYAEEWERHFDSDDEDDYDEFEDEYYDSEDYEVEDDDEYDDEYDSDEFDDL